MTVVKMQKLLLVGLKQDRRKIMTALAGEGTVQIVETEVLENTQKRTSTKSKEEVERKVARLQFAFSFFADIKKELQSKQNKAQYKSNPALKLLKLGKENKLLSYEDMYAVTKAECDLFATVEALEEINVSLTNLKTERAKAINLSDQLHEYLGLPLRFDQIKDTQHAALFAGVIPEENRGVLEQEADALGAGVEFYFANDRKLLVVAVVHKEHKKAMQALLARCDYTKCPFTLAETAEGATLRLAAEVKELDEKRAELLDKTTEYFGAIQDLKVLYDYYFIEKAKLESMEGNRETKKVFVMEGWLPAACADKTLQKIKDKAPRASFLLSDPQEGDQVPVMLQNSTVVAAFGDNITASYGMPSYGGVDPNPFVAFFYFLFFGFMFSDAGYGLVMSLACLAYLLIKKPKKRSGSFFLMFFFCGLSTLFWGALFGGWFSIDAEVLAGNGFGRFLLSMKVLDPMDGQDILVMFGLALALGALQIAVGFVLSAVNKIKAKQVWDGVLNDLSWVTIFVGGALYLGGILLKTKVLNLPGLIILGIGVAMLLLGGMVGKKNPIKMLTGAFGNLYGAINVFSDVLSYSRLFGLCLTTGIIGMVLNLIAGMMPGFFGGFGYVIAIPILLIGHAFNFGINALGVYVHNSRLQYVEFFGKFHAGEGKPFRPLGGETKYIFLEDGLTKPKKQKQPN